MVKGMCHTGTDRFNTSTRAWLKNAPNRNDERDKPPTQRVVGQMMSTGQAMFNLNATLPKPTADMWNENIRRNINTQRRGNSRNDSGHSYNRIMSIGSPIAYASEVNSRGEHRGRNKSDLSKLLNTARDHQYQEAMQLIRL